MTKDKFQVLCERILVPRMGDLMHSQLAPVHDTLEIIAAELARMERTLGTIVASVKAPGGQHDADRR